MEEKLAIAFFNHPYVYYSIKRQRYLVFVDFKKLGR